MTHIADAESEVNLAHERLQAIAQDRLALNDAQQYWQGYRDMAEKTVDWLKQAQAEVNEVKAANAAMANRLEALGTIPEVVTRDMADHALLHSRTPPAVDTGL